MASKFIMLGVTMLTFAISPTNAEEVCKQFGPQTPRDISDFAGSNPGRFPLAGPVAEMNLCNIHFHLNAEHKGPGFSVSAGGGDHGGFKCNETASLTPAELAPTSAPVCKGAKPGDTIEVHWVYSTCDVKPGKGLGSCSSPSCANPSLRVETQVFVLVNDPKAVDFARYDVAADAARPKALPRGTGKPVVYRGSTTGPSYTNSKCSPLQVTWSVRPRCAKLDINSLGKWCGNNVFEEDHAHGVRQLVTNKALLEPIVSDKGAAAIAQKIKR
ncbi:MAG: delta-class carbonic anhydrase [Hyphomicrobiaceae bacterium]